MKKVYLIISGFGGIYVTTKKRDVIVIWRVKRYCKLPKPDKEIVKQGYPTTIEDVVLSLFSGIKMDIRIDPWSMTDIVNLSDKVVIQSDERYVHINLSDKVLVTLEKNEEDKYDFLMVELIVKLDKIDVKVVYDENNEDYVMTIVTDKKQVGTRFVPGDILEFWYNMNLERYINKVKEYVDKIISSS